MATGLEAVFLEKRAQLARFLALRGAGDQADDLVQEVWFRAVRDVSGPVTNPTAYLYRTAHNLMVDWHRSESQRGVREQAWSETGSGDTPEADATPDAERHAISQSMLDAVQQEIEALGEPTCSIFRLFRIDGVPQKQIAATFGVSLPTIEKHLQRAYRAMADIRRRLDMD